VEAFQEQQAELATHRVKREIVDQWKCHGLGVVS
jgi:hypothetical protein